LGGESLRTKNKKGDTVSIEITFTHKEAFRLHLQLLTKKSKSQIQTFFKRYLRSSCAGEVVVTEEKPVVIVYKKRNENVNLYLHYEVKNRYGNKC
jgi:hypothetical protein